MEFEIEIHITQISRMMTEARDTHKKTVAYASQRNEFLMTAWRIKSRNWVADQQVFVDKSASNERTGHRRYGWAPSGVPCRVRRLLKKTERWSVIPAYTPTGYLNPIIFKGAITHDIFLQWLTSEVLPFLERPPGLPLILIMDNCRIHHSQEVSDICQEFNVQLEY